MNAYPRSERLLRASTVLLLAGALINLGFLLFQLLSHEQRYTLGAGLACLGFLFMGASLLAVTKTRRKIRRLRELHDRIESLSTELAEIRAKVEGKKGG